MPLDGANTTEKVGLVCGSGTGFGELIWAAPPSICNLSAWEIIVLVLGSKYE
jgi:hypothetical protein